MLGIFKAQSNIGTFKFSKTAEAAQLRTKVEKFVVHNPVSNASWENYCELRSLREIARSIETEEEAAAYDVLSPEASSASGDQRCDRDDLSVCTVDRFLIDDHRSKYLPSFDAGDGKIDRSDLQQDPLPDGDGKYISAAIE